MDFVTPIITPIVESLLGPVKRHLGFLVSSSNKVKYMSARLAELNNIARDVEEQKERHDANNLVVPRHVPGWLEEVKAISVKAENIPTGRLGCFNIKMRYISGKRSSCIVNDIDRLMTEKSNIKWTVEKRPLAKVSSNKASTSTLVHEDDDGTQSILKSSRDLIFNNALISLESNDNKARMMALSGMGGVGKTTMMEQLEKAVDDKKTFEWIVKVTIGKNHNPVDIQTTIAERIGEPLSEKDKDTRADRLKERFQRMSEEGKKKILIILDDVWEKIKLKDIGLSSPLPNGFKLLLTSREEDICTQMGIETSLIFKIGVLKDEEAKKLFWETLRLGSSSDIEQLDMHQTGEEILKICGGLPLAITTIASTLRDKEKFEWEDALYRLQNKKVDDYGIKEIFKISFKNLKEDDLKAIFLLSGLFPEDSNIQKEDLLRYGWGLNFYQSVRTIAGARRRVNTCVNKLIRSNLLIKSDCEGSVIMHDLVRDFVLSKFSVVKQASIVSHDNNFSDLLEEDESYERLLLKCGSMLEFPTHFNHKNLKLLKLMDGDKLLKFPEDFYTSMKKLEVLSYMNMHQPLLPQCMTNLRALCLRSCSLVDNDVSILGDLISLEVLNLAGCGIHKLPSKLGNLKRLKLLDLSGCVSLYIDDGVFENLNQLEELYMGVCQESCIRFSDTNCDELKILSRKLFALELEFFNNKAQPVNVSFENLERFKISVGCLLTKRWRWDHNNGNYSFKNTLMLETSSSELRECKINQLFRKTEILHLKVNDMSYLEDILIHPPQNAFCDLKELSISNCEGLTYLFTISMAKGLTKLEKLLVKSCSALQSVVNGENSEAGVVTFHKLKFLSLHNLPNLVSLCAHVNVTELPQLMKLHLHGLPNYTTIFPKNNNDNISSVKPFFNREVMIPKLEKLKITRMKNLKEICESEITTTVGKSENIFMLREIEVKYCSSIEVLFSIGLGQIRQLGMCSLRNIKVCRCESFREVWRIKDPENNYFIGGFQAVETIYIEKCEKFRNIVTPTTINFDMRALKDIYIQSCAPKDIYERNNELVKNNQEQEINKEDDNLSKFAFTSYQMGYSFHQLHKIFFESVKGVEVVFEIESPSNRDQIVTSQQQPLLPYLEHLTLSKMKKLSHVWKYNTWNKFFFLHKHQPQSSFQNLTSIKLVLCPGIKYLFSPLMVKLLTNLQKVTIQDCDGMEEVVSNTDEEEMASSIYAHTTATLFPRLHHLKLHDMKNLKHIGGGVAKGTTDVGVGHGQSKVSQVDAVSWFVCQYSRTIHINGCDSLSSVIPYYAAGQTQKLQELWIVNCTSMMEVFETEEINNKNTSGCSSNTTVAAPRPTNIIVHKFPNLKILKIDECDCLENIFTFSTLESLKKIEELWVRKCGAMKVIVKEEVREDTSTLSNNVVFSNLKSIRLEGLPNLAGFFLGMNIEFEWPLLECVLIENCPQMMVFTCGRSTAPRLKYIETGLGKHNLECGLNFHRGLLPVAVTRIPSPSLDCKSSSPTKLEGRTWSFHNLIQCKIDYSHKDTKIFPSNELQQLEQLETIHAQDCNNVEEVFEVTSEVTNNESQTNVKFPNLREVDLKSIRSLKYIWKSNQWRILEFRNLTKLSIDCCRSLEHVFTCSMVGCVMQLQELHIQWCSNMKVIVKEEEDCDAKVSEIIEFLSLKSLQLKSLSSLKGFYLGKKDFTLPSLDTLVIRMCPEIMVFTEGHSIIPEQTVLETSFGSFNVGEDINSFILTKKLEGFSFGNSTMISQYNYY
ncbi:putative P-loop containing nucleoside triphosphate hydrolase, leucine-rich repeat domain superfamily [Helianthus debilis subsp. tardiflorus]